MASAKTVGPDKAFVVIGRSCLYVVNVCHDLFVCCERVSCLYVVNVCHVCML